MQWIKFVVTINNNMNVYALGVANYSDLRTTYWGIRN